MYIYTFIFLWSIANEIHTCIQVTFFYELTPLTSDVICSKLYWDGKGVNTLKGITFYDYKILYLPQAATGNMLIAAENNASKQMVSGFEPLTIFGNSSILQVWLGSKYASVKI